ncbi:MAG: hypothetical protein GXP08_02640 [Gammaproteobacteria bacterium]|nr:hypothetical protein [Gammaproteobacteria bacterium]
MLIGVHSSASADSEEALMGTGAHFTWIVFDTLKEDLEKVTGRKTMLFGENSMLGVGCNADIKAAKQNALTHETFGFVCCPLSNEKIEEHQLIVYPLAKEPMLILTHENNPVSNLSIKQVRDIFRGDITNLKTVGGETRPNCPRHPPALQIKTRTLENHSTRRQRISPRAPQCKKCVRHDPTY